MPGNRSAFVCSLKSQPNPNYVGGDIGVGRQTLWQTILRPVPRWNPYRTPIRGVYLCSSATPQAPGVHGRCGELAALSALRDVFGIRDHPDIGPARLRSPATIPGPALTTVWAERAVLHASRPPSRPAGRAAPVRSPGRAPDRAVQGRAGRLSGRGVIGDAMQSSIAARPGGRVRHDIGPAVLRLRVRDSHVGAKCAVAFCDGIIFDGVIAGIRAALGPEMVIRVENLGGVALGARHGPG